MRYLRSVVALAGIIAATACHLVDVSGANGSGCPSSAVITAGAGIADFKQRIQRQTAVAPADSILDVVLVFDGAVAQADLDAIAAGGGTNVSSAGSVTAVRASFPAQALADYVAGDQARLNDAIIYIPS